MASIKYSALVTEMKGRLSGGVLQGGAAGPIIRSNRYRKQPWQLFKQQGQTQLYAAITQWRAASISERKGWGTIAPQWPVADKFGNSITLPGYQCFLHLAGNAWSFPATYISNPPNNNLDCDLTGLLVTASIGGPIEVKWPNVPPDASGIAIYARPPIAPWRSESRRGWRFMLVADPALLQISIFSEYRDAFGTPPIGSNIQVQAYGIAQAKGNFGVKLQAEDIY